MTDKREVDSALILIPLYINAPYQGFLKLVKATQKGEKLKQGCHVTRIELETSRTEGRALTNCATLAP